MSLPAYTEELNSFPSNTPHSGVPFNKLSSAFMVYFRCSLQKCCMKEDHGSGISWLRIRRNFLAFARPQISDSFLSLALFLKIKSWVRISKLEKTDIRRLFQWGPFNFYSIMFKNNPVSPKLCHCGWGFSLSTIDLIQSLSKHLRTLPAPHQGSILGEVKNEICLWSLDITWLLLHVLNSRKWTGMPSQLLFLSWGYKARFFYEK